MTDTLIILAVAAVLLVVVGYPFVRKRWGVERQAEEAEVEAERYGLDVPASLHPVVDPAACLGCGACVRVCPEGDVLGLIDGQAQPIQPARCVGHGLCQRACPTDAIDLVFGTAERGVDIPRIQGNFETNVPGIYVVGELGGMGLVKNAFEQGRQCIEGIAKEDRTVPDTLSDDVLDLLVVGCGPAGLSASVNAIHHGLDFVTVEKEPDLGGAVRHYPRRKLVMTRPFEVPGYGTLDFEEVQKEDLVAVWRDMIETTGLEVRTGETVQAVTPADDECFVVETGAGVYKTRRVVLAIGRRGIPRELGIPGEEGENVAYSLTEPEHYAGRRITVVGGGDSAIEATLMLADQPDTTVRLSYRKAQLSRIKPRNLDRFETAVAAGKLEPLWETNLARIGPDEVAYTDADGTEHILGNDDVFIFIGGELPTAFLEACGIEMDTHFGRPRPARA